MSNSFIVSVYKLFSRVLDKMPNNRKRKNEPLSEEKKEYLRQYRQQIAENAPKKEAASEPLPASRPCKAKDPHGCCPVCPGHSSEVSPGPSVPLDQQVLEADVTIPLATVSAIRSRPILQAERRFSHHHRKLSLSTQRRPQSLGSGLRTGLFRRQHSITLPTPTKSHVQHKIPKHSASSLKLSTYLRRAKRKFTKANFHAPLIQRPSGNRIVSCIQLETSVKDLACGSCGKKKLLLEENTARNGWASCIRWKCRGCPFYTEWTSTSARVSPKGAFEVSAIMGS